MHTQQDVRGDLDDVAECKRLDRLSRFGSLGIAATDLVLNLRRRKALESKASRIAPEMHVPRSRAALAAAHSLAAASTSHASFNSHHASSSQFLSAAADRGEWGVGGEGGAAVERALGSFSLGLPPSLIFTRKGGQLPYPVPVEKRGSNFLEHGNR